MRQRLDGCPHCHAPAPADPVSTTRFRAWLLCLSCGHVWTVSRLALAVRACRRRRPLPSQPAVLEDAAVLESAEGTFVTPLPAGDHAVESWLASTEPVSAGSRAWTSVDAWLDADPLPVTSAPRDRALEDEWGLSRRPEAVRPNPRTLMERLDALYQGMVQLERFVQNSTRREEALAAASVADVPAANATPPRPRPRLVVSRDEKSHAA